MSEATFRTLRRSIHTDLFTPKAQEILYRVRLYMLYDWGSNQMIRNAMLANIECAPNGEVLWNVYEAANDSERSWKYCYYSNSTYAARREDKKVREWLSSVLKEICYRQFMGQARNLDTSDLNAKELHKMWNRNNTDIVKALSNARLDPRLPKIIDERGYANFAKYTNKFGPITVAEIYCVYEKLLNRKHFEKAYSKKMKQLIVGTEKDAIATELEIARREEVDRINQKFEADKKALSDECNKKISDMREEILAAYKQMKKDLIKEHDNELAKLEDSLNFMENKEDNSSLDAALFG